MSTGIPVHKVVPAGKEGKAAVFTAGIADGEFQPAVMRLFVIPGLGMKQPGFLYKCLLVNLREGKGMAGYIQAVYVGAQVCAGRWRPHIY